MKIALLLWHHHHLLYKHGDNTTFVSALCFKPVGSSVNSFMECIERLISTSCDFFHGREPEIHRLMPPNSLFDLRFIARSYYFVNV